MRIGGWTCGGQSSLASSPGSLLKMGGGESLGTRLQGVGTDGVRKIGNDVGLEDCWVGGLLGWRIAGLEDCRLGLHVARCGMCSISICT